MANRDLVYLEAGPPDEKTAVFMMLPCNGWDPGLLVEPAISLEVVFTQRGGHQKQAWIAVHNLV